MLEIGVRDGGSATLAAMPAHLRDALSRKAVTLAAALEAKIQQKLSGGVLNMRTGALARSIVVTTDDSAGTIAATIASNGDVKYAAIHEFGGVISPHEILPDKAKTLAFVVGGKQTFAARVSLPAVAMPEQSYMRSSLAEMADEIAGSLREATAEAIEQ